MSRFLEFDLRTKDDLEPDLVLINLDKIICVRKRDGMADIILDTTGGEYDDKYGYTVPSYDRAIKEILECNGQRDMLSEISSYRSFDEFYDFDNGLSF